jgi:methylmalonyl-CoA decarboxylase subunit alpha
MTIARAPAAIPDRRSTFVFRAPLDPRETRAVLCEFVEDAQRILASQLGRPPILFLP